MKKNFALVFFAILLVNCKSHKVLNGKYRTSIENREYILDMNTKKYSTNNSNGGHYKGKFRIISISRQKALLILNDLILTKNADFIKEIDENCDSIYIGMFHSMIDNGSTVFEITITNKDSITFRKTYSNQLAKTIDTGLFTKY